MMLWPDDEYDGYNEDSRHDGLDAAHGLLLGLAVGLFCWGALILAAWLALH